MARKKDPIQAVVEYFQSVDLGDARLALGVVSAIVRTRAGKPKAKPVAKLVGKPRSPDPPDKTDPPAAPVPARSVGAVARRRKPKDVPLPGMPGPVSEVGG